MTCASGTNQYVKIQLMSFKFVVKILFVFSHIFIMKMNIATLNIIELKSLISDSEIAMVKLINVIVVSY